MDLALNGGLDGLGELCGSTGGWASKGRLATLLFIPLESVNGFLVKSPRTFEEFTMVSVWNIEGFGKITHTLETFVEDTDYDLVSHDVLLAQGSYRAQASEQCRVHPVYKNIAPVHIEPKMESLLSTEPNFENDVCETHSWGMLVRSRDEGFKAMTMPSAPG